MRSLIFIEYWPMAVGMVVGSLIGGSTTPVGGGVVAFPVAVLALGMDADQARDVTVLTQTVGMGAASYMLCLKHNLLLEFAMIATFICVGTLGVLGGLWMGSASSHVYMGVTFCFSLVLLYMDAASARSPAAPPAIAVRRAPSALVASLAYLPMGACALAGGYLTACVGFGSDLCLYTFGKLLWNRLLPHRGLSDHALSASSVVTMGALSSITALARCLTGGISSPALHCWGAAACIVCIGAPIGSLLLTDKADAADAAEGGGADIVSGRAVFWQRAVRAIFYLLAFSQLTAFAVLAPPPRVFWWQLALAVAGVVVVLAIHALLTLTPTPSTPSTPLRRPRPHATPERSAALPPPSTSSPLAFPSSLAALGPLGHPRSVREGSAAEQDAGRGPFGGRHSSPPHLHRD